MAGRRRAGRERECFQLGMPIDPASLDVDQLDHMSTRRRNYRAPTADLGVQWSEIEKDRINKLLEVKQKLLTTSDLSKIVQASSTEALDSDEARKMTSRVLRTALDLETSSLPDMSRGGNLGEHFYITIEEEKEIKKERENYERQQRANAKAMADATFVDQTTYEDKLQEGNVEPPLRIESKKSSREPIHKPAAIFTQHDNDSMAILDAQRTIETPEAHDYYPPMVPITPTTTGEEDSPREKDESETKLKKKLYERQAKLSQTMGTLETESSQTKSERPEIQRVEGPLVHFKQDQPGRDQAEKTSDFAIPDFCLPDKYKTRIKDLSWYSFSAKSNKGNPMLKIMTYTMVEQLGTKNLAIDKKTGDLYAIYDNGWTITDAKCTIFKIDTVLAEPKDETMYTPGSEYLSKDTPPQAESTRNNEGVKSSYSNSYRLRQEAEWRDPSEKVDTKKRKSYPNFYVPDGYNTRLAQLPHWMDADKSSDGHDLIRLTSYRMAAKHPTCDFLINAVTGEMKAILHTGIYSIPDKCTLEPWTEEQMMLYRGGSNLTPLKGVLTSPQAEKYPFDTSGSNITTRENQRELQDQFREAAAAIDETNGKTEIEIREIQRQSQLDREEVEDQTRKLEQEKRDFEEKFQKWYSNLSNSPEKRQIEELEGEIDHDFERILKSHENQFYDQLYEGHQYLEGEKAAEKEMEKEYPSGQRIEEIDPTFKEVMESSYVGKDVTLLKKEGRKTKANIMALSIGYASEITKNKPEGIVKRMTTIYNKQVEQELDKLDCITTLLEADISDTSEENDSSKRSSLNQQGEPVKENRNIDPRSNGPHYEQIISSTYRPNERRSSQNGENGRGPTHAQQQKEKDQALKAASAFTNSVTPPKPQKPRLSQYTQSKYEQEAIQKKFPKTRIKIGEDTLYWDSECEPHRGRDQPQEKRKSMTKREEKRPLRKIIKDGKMYEVSDEFREPKDNKYYYSEAQRQYEVSNQKFPHSNREFVKKSEKKGHYQEAPKQNVRQKKPQQEQYGDKITDPWVQPTSDMVDKNHEENGKRPPNDDGENYRKNRREKDNRKRSPNYDNNRNQKNDYDQNRPPNRGGNGQPPNRNDPPPPHRGGNDPPGRGNEENQSPNGNGGDDSPDDSSSESTQDPRRGPRGHRGYRGWRGNQGYIGPIGPSGLNPLPSTTVPSQLNVSTAFEQSLSDMNKSMMDMIKVQQNFLLRTGDTQDNHIKAIEALTKSNNQRSFDHVFADIPKFDGENKEDFFDWIDALEAMCLQSGRDIHTEAMGRSNKEVRDTIMSMPKLQKWSVTKEVLRINFSNLPTMAHAAAQLEVMMQKPKESLRSYIYKYAKMLFAATSKTARFDTDRPRCVRFLASIQNTSISDKVARSDIFPRTLQECFEKTLWLENKYQISDGINQSRPSNIMEAQANELRSIQKEISEIGIVKDPRAQSNHCWGCGQLGHFRRDCPKATEVSANSARNPPNVGPIVGQMVHTFTAQEPVSEQFLQNVLQDRAKDRNLKRKYKQKYQALKATIAPPTSPTGPIMTPRVVSSVPGSIMGTTSPKTFTPGTAKTTTTISGYGKPKKQAKGKSNLNPYAKPYKASSPAMNTRAQTAKKTAVTCQELQTILEQMDEEEEEDSDITSESEQEEEEVVTTQAEVHRIVENDTEIQ
jgi:hypothetical protein